MRIVRNNIKIEGDELMLRGKLKKEVSFVKLYGSVQKNLKIRNKNLNLKMLLNSSVSLSQIFAFIKVNFSSLFQFSFSS